MNSSTSFSDKSPWSAEELLAKTAGQWLPHLLEYQSKDPFWSGMEGSALLSEVIKAITQDPEWGFNLADALIKNEVWEGEIWPSIIFAWEKMKLDKAQYCHVFCKLDRAELYRHHRSVVDLLLSFIKDKDCTYRLHLRPKANGIAKKLWLEISQGALQQHRSSDWLTDAINDSAGKVAEFWIESFSLWHKSQDPKPESLNDEYREAMSEIVRDNSHSGTLGKTVIAGHFSYLRAVDVLWADEHLLPLFTDEGDVFYAAWDGFLSWSRINQSMVKIMEHPFLNAVKRMRDATESQDSLSEGFVVSQGDLYDKFVENYATMVIYLVDDPLKEWIPVLYNNGGEEMSDCFAYKIGKILHYLDDTAQKELWQRWLKRHWENRLVDKPTALKTEETTAMLEWLPFLNAVFDEAVAVAVQMKNASLEYGWPFHFIAKSELPQTNPASVAELLIYLRNKADVRARLWHSENVQEIISVLLQSNLAQDTKDKLREIKSERG